MPTVNIGILAHVDAGKTSLTERLLFQTGAIGRLGSVHAGTTQTDTGDIERRRGITIRSAVAAFHVGDLQVNLIDTPGHSDFVAEVERAVGVLDGAVLVLSAVEGVQAHTRVLMKTLRALRMPTLLFVNKVDRFGARDTTLLADIRRLLTPYAVPVNSVSALGTRDARVSPAGWPPGARRDAAAQVLAEHSDELLAALVEGSGSGADFGSGADSDSGAGSGSDSGSGAGSDSGSVPSEEQLWSALESQSKAGVAFPLFFGSALTGEGVPALLDGIARLLPRAGASQETDADGTVFAVERGSAGEKIAYLRLRSGALRNRTKVTLHRRDPNGTPGSFQGRITSLQVVGAPNGTPASAGDIARIGGLPAIRVGDRLGAPPAAGTDAHFAAPSLETIVHPRDPAQATRLHAALVALADADPLIRTCVLLDGSTSVLLYGEVQKEVLGETLAAVYGVEAEFSPSRPVYRERPSGVGEAVEDLRHFPRTRFIATVGLRVSPAPIGTGTTFDYETQLGALPYTFHHAIEETVHKTLAQGLHGWEVADAHVTLTRSGFAPPGTTAADFRNLTPIVLMHALAEAGTRVYEPCHTFELEVPASTVSPITGHLVAHEAEITHSSGDGTTWTFQGSIPVRTVQDVEKALPSLAHGEAAWWSRPSGDRLVRGAPPVRARTDGNPLDLKEYLRFLSL